MSHTTQSAQIHALCYAGIAATPRILDTLVILTEIHLPTTYMYGCLQDHGTLSPLLTQFSNEHVLFGEVHFKQNRAKK